MPRKTSKIWGIPGLAPTPIFPLFCFFKISFQNYQNYWQYQRLD